MSDESERASVSVLASRKKETLDYRYPFGRVGSGLDLRNGDFLLVLRNLLSWSRLWSEVEGCSIYRDYLAQMV